MVIYFNHIFIDERQSMNKSFSTQNQEIKIFK